MKRQPSLGDDASVSPVVAVILLVAVTVVLSAVVGTFALNLGESVDSSPQASVTVDQTYNENGTYTVDARVATMDTADEVRLVAENGSVVGTATSVGEVASTATARGHSEYRVVAVSDGGKRIIQQTNVKCTDICPDIIICKENTRAFRRGMNPTSRFTVHPQ